MVIDFNSWKHQQGLYDILVLGLNSEEDRYDYIINLYWLGVRDEYIFPLVNIGLEKGLSEVKACELLFRIEGDYSFAIKNIEEMYENTFVLHPDIREKLISSALIDEKNVAVSLYELIENAKKL